jgi:hypothetical protein
MHFSGFTDYNLLQNLLMNLWIRVRYVVRLFAEDNGQSQGVYSHSTTQYGFRKLRTTVSPALCRKLHILSQLMQTY